MSNDKSNQCRHFSRLSRVKVFDSFMLWLYNENVHTFYNAAKIHNFSELLTR